MKWQKDLTHLVHNTEHQNELKVKLQGRENLISSYNMKAFQIKL
jgi:hypothetical protein